MARPNAIKSSKYRKDIDDMLASGETYINIHKWLKNKKVSISRQTISNYHKNDFNIHDTAREIYNDKHSKDALNYAAGKQVDVLEYYDKLIEKGQNTNFFEMSDKEKHDLALKAAKQKSDYLKAEPESPTFIFGLDSKKERLKRIEGNNEYNCPRENSTTDESDS